ncbi:MAG: hypothetical protein EHM70_18075 [Chloroflexota bacterium]|nr:MAG: hypothetical protein EHM70_18075 [Chloroflexota bacterium]
MDRPKVPGPVIALYRPRPSISQGAFFQIFIGAVLVLLPLSTAGEQAWYAHTHYGPVAASAWASPWLYLSLAGAIAWLGIAAVGFVRARRFIAIHEDGLRYASLGGPLRTLVTAISPGVLYWHELTGIATGTTEVASLTGKSTHSHCRTTIYRQGGAPLTLKGSDRGGIQNLPELTTRLKARLYPRLQRRMEARFENNQWIDFGPISIHPKELRIRNKAYPWKQVHKIYIKKGYLLVELEQPVTIHRRPTASKNLSKPVQILIPVSQIPNLELLLKLIEEGVNP